MTIPLNKELYKQVKEDVIRKYPKHSAYRSMLIQKKYKELGGKYKIKKDKNLKRWLDEEWINAYAYINQNKIVKCGDKDYKTKSACRPLKRVSEKTPLTIKEVLKIHGKKKLNELISKKNKDPSNIILSWKNGKIINKK